MSLFVWLGGGLAVALLAYLVVAMMKPEWF
jgi:K+-transporting ATPase KdpF subunit